MINASGSAILKMQPAETTIAVKDKNKAVIIKSIRDLIKIALENEDLLKKFVKINKDKEKEFLENYLPNFIGELASRAGIEPNAGQLEDLKNIFIDKNKSNLQLYVKNIHNGDLYDNLCEYSDVYSLTKYFLENAQRGKEIISKFIPSIYKNFPFKISFIPSKEGVNFYYQRTKKGGHEFGVQVNEDLEGKKGDYGLIEIESSFDYQFHMFRRRAYDLVSIIHEYCHGIYAEITGYFSNTTEDYHKKADAALSEGFAVFIELFLCDKMIVNSALLGLDEWDVWDLKKQKEYRINWMHGIFDKQRKESKTKSETNYYVSMGMAYVEGTIKFMHKLYKQGGIEEIKKFLESIDINKALTIERDSKEYKEALGDPEKFKKLFGKGI